jgi:uncharacterized protein (TIGR02118 family)
MIKLVALWSEPSDKDGFDADYDATHRVLCEKLPGVTATFSKAMSGPYYRVAELAFASQEDLGAALGGPGGAELMADSGRLQEAFGNKVETLMLTQI